MKRHHLSITISAFLLFYFFNAAVIEAQIDPHSKEFATAVDSIFADKAAMTNPGAAVIIMKGENTILSKTYGSANLAFKVPFTENTLFPISNFTDQLVAFSILQLEKKSLIKLTDPVNKYLPEFGFQNDILITHLLNHSSDLPFLASLRLMAGWKFSDPFYHNDFLNLTKKFTKGLKPDKEIQHNHTGIKILQLLVEKVSKVSFSAYTSANIFQPLGMTNTVVKHEQLKENKNNSIGYSETDDEYKRAYPTELASMCPMTYTTQADFEKWMLNIQTKKFEKSIIDKMDQALLLKGKSQERVNRAYCVGQQQYYTFLGEDEFYLMDVNDGHSWKWIRLQQSDLSIMAIGNLDSYIGSKVNAIARLMTGFSANSSTEETKASPIKLSEKEMQAYTGYFWDRDYYFASHVTIKDGALYYTDMDNDWNFPLKPLSKSLFIEPAGTKIEFTKLNGNPELTVIIPSGSKYYSDKYDAEKLNEIDRSKYAGLYTSDKLNIFYELTVEDNKLILKRSRKPDLELVPIGKNKFRTAEVDFRLITFEEDAKRSVSQMKMSNTGLKNVEFRKL